MVICKDIISLSKEFFGGKETAIEVKVKVISSGQQSDIIYQYISFTKIVDSQRKLYGRSLKAITETIRICKERNILKDYLTSHEKEVVNIMFALYDQEKIWENAIASERREQAEETAHRLYENGVSIEVIAASFQYDVNTVKKWLGVK